MAMDSFAKSMLDPCGRCPQWVKSRCYDKVALIVPHLAYVTRLLLLKNAGSFVYLVRVLYWSLSPVLSSYHQHRELFDPSMEA